MKDVRFTWITFGVCNTSDYCLWNIRYASKKMAVTLWMHYFTVWWNGIQLILQTSSKVASKQALHFLKISDIWWSSYLEILAISLWLLSFSSCKECWQFTKTLYFGVLHKSHEFKSAGLENHNRCIINHLPNTCSCALTEKFTVLAMTSCVK